MTRVIGIDEVGRGALAGPVVVAAAVMPKGLHLSSAGLGKLKDSKKLSAFQRERWYKYFKHHPEIDFAVARVYPRGIERLNISRAANVAAKNAYEKLIKTMASDQGRHRHATQLIFLDGGLHVGNKNEPKNAKTIIKGDEKIPAVAVASIVAKVVRDRFMVRLAQNYPHYDFEVHKGYGTPAHMKAIKKNGVCVAHRLTFLTKQLTMN